MVPFAVTGKAVTDTDSDAVQISLPVLPLRAAVRHGVVKARGDYQSEVGWPAYVRLVEQHAASADVIVAGARCAGSPTAMLLARKGYRVLLVDKATFPSDTMSGHYIHQPGVACLERWGLRFVEFDRKGIEVEARVANGVSLVRALRNIDPQKPPIVVFSGTIAKYTFRDPAQGYEILAELMMDAGKPDEAADFARRSDPNRVFPLAMP